MKNIKALIGGLALAAIVGVNGYMAMADRVLSYAELQLNGLENVAEGEISAINGKGESFLYDCWKYQLIYFDANGNANLPDGSSLTGAANSYKMIYCKFTAVNCGGASRDYCKRIRCK